MLRRRTVITRALDCENTISLTTCTRCQRSTLNLRDVRYGSSASSKRWQNRQGNDWFAREARVQGLKSRAAFKLLEINEKYKILKKGQTVIDLGYAPGSWTEVAVDRTAPNGRVIGIDIIPAKPPKGATAIQGNFLSPSVQAEVKHMLRDPDRGRPRPQRFFIDDGDELDSLTEEGLEETERSYIDLERHATAEEYRENNSIITIATQGIIDDGNINQQPSSREEEKPKKKDTDKTVDVVLSDMSAPWEQTTGFHKRSLSEPYFRMMNTSGIPFRDHAGSMDLCNAALEFCFDTLRVGGHFVCKFYQGVEDKSLETRIRRLFKTVHREKPEASRRLSREAYFVALKRDKDVSRQDVFR